MDSGFADLTTSSRDRLVPANPEAEQAVLGSILIDPDAVIRVAAFLKTDDFYQEKNGWIYQAILDLHERREPADFLTVTDELDRRRQLDEVGGPAYVMDLINAVPTAIHVEHYARIVERTSVLRKLIRAAGQIAQIAYEETTEDIGEVVDRAEQIVFSVAERRAQRDLVAVRTLMGDVVDRIDFLYHHRGEILGVPTGFKLLDKMLGGLQKSDLVILAARPGVGKTSLAISLAQNAARKYGKRVAVFSLEMSNEQLVQRMLSAETGIDSQRLRLGDIQGEEEWHKLMEAAGALSDAPIYIDDTPAVSAMELRTKARRLYAEHDLDLIVVDYLQLMQGDRRSENRVQEISAISRGLKGLARELNVPVLALSQLSRAVESRQIKIPMLSDLRESGCLTGDSLVVLADTGARVPMSELIGKSGFRILALNETTLKIEPAEVSRTFSTGIKPVYRLVTGLGREIRATGNHPFRTFDRWKRLDQLKVGDRIAVPAMQRTAVTTRQMQQALGSAHSGTGLYKQNVSRERANRLASAVGGDQHLTNLASSDVYWDEVKAIEPAGEEEVFDLTVPVYSNFVVNDIIAHNSIEQDADVVLFIYREEMYNEDTEKQNIADVIIAKHRNGPTGSVSLFFRKELTQFRDLEMRREELE
jgi:replicative DNA helicase